MGDPLRARVDKLLKRSRCISLAVPMSEAGDTTLAKFPAVQRYMTAWRNGKTADSNYLNEDKSDICDNAMAMECQVQTTTKDKLKPLSNLDSWRPTLPSVRNNVAIGN